MSRRRELLQPPGRSSTLASLRLGAWGEDERPRVEPFAAIELELQALWLPGDGPATEASVPR